MELRRFAEESEMTEEFGAPAARIELSSGRWGRLEVDKLGRKLGCSCWTW